MTPHAPRRLLPLATSLIALATLAPTRAFAYDPADLAQLEATHACQGCDLSYAYLYGNFDGADVAGANLTGSNLGKASWRDADLTGADLTDAYLRQTDLTGATLDDAVVTGADLILAVCEGASLQGVGLADAHWVNGIKLRGADLRGADLHGLPLNHGHLEGCDLRNADLSFVGGWGTYLAGADLRGADLTYAGLYQADLTGAVLDGLDLHGTWSLQGAVLDDASLHGVDLSGAHLKLASLRRVDLTETSIAGADLTSSDLTAAVAVWASLEGTRFVDATLDAFRCVQCSGQADFTGASMVGARLAGYTAERWLILDGADATGLDLSGADISVLSAEGASLVQARFEDGFVHMGSLAGADLSDSDYMLLETGFMGLCGTVMPNGSVTSGWPSDPGFLSLFPEPEDCPVDAPVIVNPGDDDPDPKDPGSPDEPQK